MHLNCGVGKDPWVPCTARTSNQSILKEISSEYSLEGLRLKLKLQYSGHLMRRTDSLKKTLMLRKIEGRRRRGPQGTRWLDGISNQWTWVWASSRSWWWTGKPGMLQSTGSQKVRLDWATERLSNNNKQTINTNFFEWMKKWQLFFNMKRSRVRMRIM